MGEEGEEDGDSTSVWFDWEVIEGVRLDRGDDTVVLLRLDHGDEKVVLHVVPGDATDGCACDSTSLSRLVV